ncbi:MAG: CvpA family protein [Hungatella sp.]
MNWLEIAVIIYLISMVLYGHYKGFIRLAVSLVAFIATLIIVNAAMPQVSEFLKENTQVFTWIEQGVENVIGIEETQEDPDSLPSAQRLAIESLKLPQQIKDILIENNNQEVYRILGVDAFQDYIGEYLANMMFHVVGFLILFVIVFLGIRLLMHWLDLMARLPILSGLNKIAGAILGGVEGLIYLWIIGLILTAFSGIEIVSVVMRAIEQSTWLSFLFHYNILMKIIVGALYSI